VRSATKTFVGLAGIGVLVATAKLGMPLPVAANTVAASGTQTAAPEATATPGATAKPTPKPASGGTSTKPATKPAKKPGSTSTKPATPAPAPAPTTTSVSQSGSAISYKYGVVQVKVTKEGGNITAITYLKKSATDGRSAVFPDLVVAAKAANGSNIRNISKATFTTDAFKKALDSALAKF
jgi:uncharacterized protein with FMN-binding domain